MSKKGIGLQQPYSQDATALGASWLYNWRYNPPVAAGVESVPMIYDTSQVGKTLGGNSSWLLGFNEPDRPDQANLTPEAAATAWRQMEQLYPNKSLVAPAPSHECTEWVIWWWEAYQNLYGQAPRVDAFACHTYENNLAACKATVQKFIDLSVALGGTRKVWLTEFAFTASTTRSINAAITEAGQFIAWLEAQPLVARYAWFPNRLNMTQAWTGPNPEVWAPLLNLESGKFTAYGVWYTGL